jgi:cell division protein FtsI (penicillin-binding protein 3)
LVAIDEKRFRLWAHPRYFNLPGDNPNLVRPPEDVVEVLAPHLAIPASELLKSLKTRPSGIKLGEQIDPETAKRIQALGISGLDLEAYPQRVYPQASLFASVVGFQHDGHRILFTQLRNHLAQRRNDVFHAVHRVVVKQYLVAR